MPDTPADFIQYAFQLPIVGLVIWLVFKFIGVMKEERTAFLGELKEERESREENTQKLETTLTGLTTGVNDLHHAVTEMRSDVRSSRNTTD